MLSRRSALDRNECKLTYTKILKVLKDRSGLKQLKLFWQLVFNTELTLAVVVCGDDGGAVVVGLKRDIHSPPAVFQLSLFSVETTEAIFRVSAAGNSSVYLICSRCVV